MNPPKIKQDFFFGTSNDLPKIVEITLSDIRPNPDQPRKTFREESLAELVASIERHGLLQPVTVKRQEDGAYLLVAGERRFRAFERLNRPTIPAILTTGDAEEIALIENLQREDLNPLEEAEALARMMDRHRYSQEELGRAVGKSQAAISKVLGLLTLPEAIKTDYGQTEGIGKWMLIEIAQLPDEAARLAMWQAIRTGQYTTVKAVKSARLRTKTATPTPPELFAVKAGRRFLKALEDLESPHPIALSEATLNELLALRNQVAATLERLTPGVEDDNATQ